jgi:hypothetical protein
MLSATGDALVVTGIVPVRVSGSGREVLLEGAAGAAALGDWFFCCCCCCCCCEGGCEGGCGGDVTFDACAFLVLGDTDSASAVVHVDD